ncbi:MAG TPA: folate-binding protein, partial [Solirubrobacteraceae bacterium]|nr:folate-binding protein [Solirubrobacteraceae bacterium]
MATSPAATDEREALDRGAGMVDRSERGKLALAGAGAAEFLNGLVTNDVEALEPGTGCYAAVLTPKGKMLGDLRVLRTEDGELLLDTERSALQEVFNVLWRGRIGYDVEIHKRTLQTGLLSLAGPRAREIAGEPSPPAIEHAHVAAQIAGVPVRLVATDVGVEVLCDAERTEAVAQALRERGAVPVSEGALEALRVERGRPRYGVDLDDSTIPQEAGLNERAVSFTKGCYVGQETVARLFYRGKPNRHLRGLRLAGPAATGDELRLDGRTVGRVGTVAESPRHGTIALALVRREAEPGATLEAGA